MLQTEVYMEENRWLGSLRSNIKNQSEIEAILKEYEEKMCGNDVNRNNDRIFSWLWKQQGRKR